MLTSTSRSDLHWIWQLAWPVIALGWLRTLTLLVDSVFVGQLGPAPLAAIGGGAFAFWMVDQLSELAALGTQTRVAHAIGGKRHEALGRIVLEGAALGSVLAMLLVVGSVTGPEAYASLVGFEQASPEHEACSAFLRAMMLGAPGIVLLAVASGTLRGLGWNRHALLITALSLLTNAALDPVLIWGWWGVPPMGVAGAAVATSLGAALGGVVGLVVLLRTTRWGWASPRWPGMVRTLMIGGPVAVSSVGFSFVYVALGRLLVTWGPEQIAALGIGHRFEGFAYLACVGMMTAAATAVGQRLGAQDLEGAWRCVRMAEAMSVVLMLVFAVIAWFGVRPAYEVVTDDLAVIDAGVLYVMVQLAVWAFMAPETVYQGAFAGAGHTTPSLWIGGTLTLLRLPVAYVLGVGLGLGALGVWLAIACSTAAKGICFRWWFWRMVAREQLGKGLET